MPQAVLGLLDKVTLEVHLQVVLLVTTEVVAVAVQ
jgi:hypothetical protein